MAHSADGSWSRPYRMRGCGAPLRVTNGRAGLCAGRRVIRQRSGFRGCDAHAKKVHPLRFCPFRHLPRSWSACPWLFASRKNENGRISLPEHNGHPKCGCLFKDRQYLLRDLAYGKSRHAIAEGTEKLEGGRRLTPYKNSQPKSRPARTISISPLSPQARFRLSRTPSAWPPVPARTYP